jgi:hypothetical protein
MTGPEHYTAAERLAVDAQSIQSAIHAEDDLAVRAALASQHTRITARGQLHATLALAAATVRQRTPTTGSWDEVLR